MKKIFALIVMLAATLGMQAQDTWTVTGVPALCGESWDPTIEANDMTTTDGKNYTWTKHNVAMKAGTAYGFKVVQNHAWDNYVFGGAAGGQGSDIYEIKVDENGAYTVTITFVFDEENSTISHEAVKTGEAEFEETTYTVAGVTVLCGVEWNPEATDNDMVSTDGGVTYTWTKQNVPLEGGVGYGFKICEDHAWTTAYGDDEGLNYMLTVNEDGEYTVVITFTVETKAISVETTKTADHDFGEKTWTIAGVLDLMGSDWDPSDTNNDMTKVEEGIYKLVKENVSLLGAVEYQFKVLSNHSWTENYGADGEAGGQNVVLMVEEDGNYDVTFTFFVETKTLLAGAVVTTGEEEENRVNTPVVIRDNDVVTITTTTEGATIHYTMDGSTPTITSTKYDSPITVTENGVIKAYAVKDDFIDSRVTTYKVDWFKVEAVAISFANLKVVLSTPTANATIYYTTNGNTPTMNSPLYTAPFSVSSNCTVKAIAYRENFNPSDVASLYIDLDNVKCDAPAIRQDDTELTMTTVTEETTIYYTLDGTMPTVESSVYDSPITLTRNCTVKAFAVKEGYLDSEVSTYEVSSFQVLKPLLSVAGNEVTITCETEGASIYYLLGEGTIELTEQNRYTAPITLTDNRPVRAIGVLDGYHNSEEAVFTPDVFFCAAVTVSYNGRYVTLSSATEGASIYYTTDGSAPSKTSQSYNGSFTVEGLCTINAIAAKAYLNNSDMTSMEIGYVYDGQNALVSNAGLLSMAFDWNHGTAASEKLVVKGPLNATDLSFLRTLSSVSYLDLRDAVIEGSILPDHAFSGMNLISIELPAGLSKASASLFDGCNRLAAIVWNANISLSTESLSGVSNPNLLLYVNSLSQAPVTMNVVSMINNSAANIVLQDVEEGNSNFYCPRPFRADKISYKHRYTLESGKGASGGWETIALPFTVATITHEVNGRLSPFGSNVADAKPFWLYSLQATGFTQAVEIVANTPYIICMPNHLDYAEDYNQNGVVEFAATNVEVPVTSVAAAVQESSNSTISLIPTFSQIDQSAGVYALNREGYAGYAPGSIFVYNLRTVHPFEAYSTVTMKSSGAKAPHYISVAEQMATAIQEVPGVRAGGSVKVYTLNGVLVKTGQREDVLKTLPKGIYIVSGKKVIVK